MTNEDLARAFLAAHPTFDGWEEAWRSVPLAFRVGLTHDLPPRDVIASVRAVVSKGRDVLLVRAEVPILTVGGRPEAGETLEEGLIREIAEETGWLARPIGVIAFIHALHLDEQRPSWGRPAPHFIDVVFAAEAANFEPSRLHLGEWPCEFVPIEQAARHGLHPIDLAFLKAASALRRDSP
ncbi:NUDIX domain-containing protein [Deinococcus yavapaiensis]|uniref:ADP-ribose pyrophosphatase YjhB (NUDIX family) n=1 Tax=Deinococcus yavapaiensis KR-236 TaxID=694435 RepID=A0A318SEY2_9DEIO|nr:NUDIX hydrolase [Deinococcus yavapaiensis]PYE55785.1 ADP-ribose pyrophosphatase YjhB (NUDIX family) [Deinococcus yavapaiensis KR-236]